MKALILGVVVLLLSLTLHPAIALTIVPLVMATGGDRRKGGRP